MQKSEAMEGQIKRTVVKEFLKSDPQSLTFKAE